MASARLLTAMCSAVSPCMLARPKSATDVRLEPSSSMMKAVGKSNRSKVLHRRSLAASSVSSARKLLAEVSWVPCMQ